MKFHGIINILQTDVKQSVNHIRLNENHFMSSMCQLTVLMFSFVCVYKIMH